MGKMPKFNLSPEEDTPQQPSETNVRHGMQPSQNESIPQEMRTPEPLADKLVDGTQRDEKTGVVLPGMYKVSHVVGKGRDKRVINHIVREDR